MNDRKWKIGDRVRTSSLLARKTITPGESRQDVRRVWASYPTESREGVLMGIRHLQNGRIIDETEFDGLYSHVVNHAWACDEVVPAGLIAYDLYLKPRLVALDEIEVVASDKEGR